MYLESRPDCAGKTLSEIGREAGKDPLSALFDLLADETGLAVMSDVTQSEDNLRLIMSHPLVSFGTDALYSSPIPHPRSFHSTVEYLARYTMKEKVMTLPEAIRKMTGENADKLGLKDRGYIKEGYKADLVLFDPDALEADGDSNRGFSVIMVGGKPCLMDGRSYHPRSGEVL